jgi:hypothetical protein
MVATLSIVATVSTLNDNFQILIGKFSPTSNRHSPAMESVESVRLQVVNRFGGLTDAGDKQDLMGFQTTVNQTAL